MNEHGEELEREGFVNLRGGFSTSQIDELREEADRLQATAGKACVRGVLQDSNLITNLARSCAGGECDPVRGMIPVRGILFDKTPEENWPVPWHQDLSIAVAQRVDVSGYSAWTVKEGVPHVQAPVELLERMVTLRIHLDETPAENGALRVVPRSHLCGRIGAAQIPGQVERLGEVLCAAGPGDALIMKPLILHSSSRAASEAGRHRRVLHLEFAPPDGLAPGLKWFERR